MGHGRKRATQENFGCGREKIKPYPTCNLHGVLHHSPLSAQGKERKKAHRQFPHHPPPPPILTTDINHSRRQNGCHVCPPSLKARVRSWAAAPGIENTKNIVCRLFVVLSLGRRLEIVLDAASSASSISPERLPLLSRHGLPGGRETALGVLEMKD